MFTICLVLAAAVLLLLFLLYVLLGAHEEIVADLRQRLADEKATRDAPPRPRRVEGRLEVDPARVIRGRL